MSNSFVMAESSRTHPDQNQLNHHLEIYDPAFGHSLTELTLGRDGYAQVYQDPISGKQHLELAGHFAKSEWELMIEDLPIYRSPEGNFLYRAPYKGEVQTQIKIHATGPKGASVTKWIYIEPVGTYAARFPPPPPPIPPRRYSIQVGLGPTSVSYTETKRPSYSGVLLTAKAGWGYSLIPKSLKMSISGFGTVTGITSSNSSASVRYIGLNGRVSYSLIQDSFVILDLSPGYYYTTMLVSASKRFGYTNLNGPQFLITSLFPMQNGRSLLSYLKLALIDLGTFSYATDAREFAAGLNFNFFKTRLGTFGVGVDYADLGFTFQKVVVSSRSISTGLSLVF